MKAKLYCQCDKCKCNAATILLDDGELKIDTGTEDGCMHVFKLSDRSLLFLARWALNEAMRLDIG